MANDNSGGYPGDADRTIFIPRPGGRGPAVPPPPRPGFDPQYQQPYSQEFITSGINPLVSAASGLVALPSRLQAMASHQNVAGLRNHILDEIKAYENKTRLAGIDPEVTYTGRYILCAFIDEAVLNTVWGSNSPWGGQSLLSTLHNETSGGENFFVILDRLLRDPSANLDLLELIYICISLGFKGRYSVMDRGMEKLEELRIVVFEQIRRKRGEFSQELSPHWQSQSNQRKSLRNYVPLWVVVAVAGALLFAVFIGFTMVLGEAANPVQQSMERIAKSVTAGVPRDTN